ncbi:sulfite exporter TauE/SafE family protein [Escherichia coli]
MEPGHSKTMMAAFIIAIKGTIKQAVMLWMAATISHTAVVWLIAFGRMVISKRFYRSISRTVAPADFRQPSLLAPRSGCSGVPGAANATGWRICTGMIMSIIITITTLDHDHGHHHHHEHGEYQDAHARTDANDIKPRFDGREVTNWQILLFGLTGGLIPCPAAITVLLICIQLKALTLGATLVVSFSIGLVLTCWRYQALVQQSAFSRSQNAGQPFLHFCVTCPHFRSLLIGLVGVYMGVHGFMGIMR